ncbi:MAG: HD domain-containing protein [Bacillota bacterium]|nr:HD domain-containing protein [Bacillota bacterium]
MLQSFGNGPGQGENLEKNRAAYAGSERKETMIEGRDRINSILSNGLYKEYLQKIARHEEHREFCHHDMEHFLAAARIAYIINLERGFNIKKDMIYAAALLHDIGRWKQYEENMSHETASAELSPEILKQSGFSEAEIHEIVGAVIGHRKSCDEQGRLEEILYYADKQSRNCFECHAASRCNWAEEKRNSRIKY